ncbi:Mevalonate kinase [Coemansia biformis]|uniref:Mevalonate kinase n=1 Tax=Coemansia biformis TaxID=1286918 RepID=A0A9W8CXZ0_9FUNG|nr:Mevalonate kinase [Coemansia biformis]
MVAIHRDTRPFVVSAPGKVIMFGEHAVVYGKSAIAGSVDMRAYALVTPSSGHSVRLVLPDIDVDVEFDVRQLPRLRPGDLAHPGDVETLLAEGIDVPEGPGRTAVLAFVYLYGSLVAEAGALGFTMCVRSLLPVGAGLGSSASFNVVLSAALLQMTGQLQGEGATEEDRRLINSWAFQGEQVAHGTPSGIDNSVATYGGFLEYTKGHGPAPLHSTHALRVIITNTNVPRSTKALVAGVRALRDAHPAVVDSILDAIHNISVTAATLFQAPEEAAGGELERQLHDVIRMNHGLLSALGVGHPSLERVRDIAAGHQMASKLTGAGGGGCALTLVPRDAPKGAAARVAAEMADEGFCCHQAVVGGAGVAIAYSVGAEPVDKWVRSMLGHSAERAPDSDAISGFATLPEATIAMLAPSH